MEVTKIDKERVGNKVLFPRTQYKGVTLGNEDNPLKEDYMIVSTEQEIPNMGHVKMIERTQENYKEVVAEIRRHTAQAAMWYALYGKLLSPELVNDEKIIKK